MIVGRSRIDLARPDRCQFDACDTYLLRSWSNLSDRDFRASALHAIHHVVVEAIVAVVSHGCSLLGAADVLSLKMVGLEFKIAR
jgi:hypothetical protein